jgi:hypothetical protein
VDFVAFSGSGLEVVLYFFKFPFSKLSKFPFSNCQNFPFLNCQNFTFQTFPFQTVKISLFKMSKFSFSKLSKFHFSNCQNFPFQLSKFPFPNCQNFPFQTIKIFLFQTASSKKQNSQQKSYHLKKRDYKMYVNSLSPFHIRNKKKFATVFFM